MGLFDKVKSFAQNLVGESTSAKIATTANKALTVLTSPIQSTVNFKKAQAETRDKSATRLALEGALNTLTVVAPLTSGGRTAIGSVATKLAPKTPVGLIATGVTGIIGGNILTSSPKARESVINAPSELASVGKGIGEFVEDPTLQNATKVVKENPITSALLALGITTLVGSKITGTVATLANTSALNESTKVAKEEKKKQKTEGLSEGVVGTSTAPVINYYITSPPVTETVAPLAEQPKAKPKKRKKKSIKRRKPKKKHGRKSKRRKVLHSKRRKSTRKRRKRSK